MTLAELIEIELIRERIAGQVDFSKEQLILFAWKRARSFENDAITT